MACGGALVWAGRQQGPRRLLAVWRALGDAHPLSGGEGRQQGRGQAAGWAPSPAAAAWSQQQLGGYCSLAALQPGAGAAPACAAQLASSAAGAARLARGPLHAWLQQRGMALNFARYQKRRGQGMPDRNLPQRNEEIKAQEVRVRFADEEKPSEVMPLRKAIKLAKGEGMDVVMVSPKAEPPVVRITEWSKVLYEAQKKEKAALKQRLQQQRAAEPKEVRIGCQIAEHDLATKMAQARRFLEEGSNLRLVVTFKGGQEIALGRDVTLYLIGQLAGLCKVKDEKQLQRPQRGHWAVLLVPEAAAPAPAPKKPAAAQQEQQREQAEPEQQQAAAAAPAAEGAAA